MSHGESLDHLKRDVGTWQGPFDGPNEWRTKKGRICSDLFIEYQCIGLLTCVKSMCSSCKVAQQHATKELRYCCSVVIGELLYGAHHGGTAHRPVNLALIAQLSREFNYCHSMTLPPRRIGEIRHGLATQGTPIGPNDLMIAAIARSKQLIVVTNNTNEFSRVPGLQVEDWQLPFALLGKVSPMKRFSFFFWR